MEVYIIIGAILIVVGSVTLAYRIYSMVVLDAVCRGLKKPKFWGLFAAGGSNGTGMFLYILGREKYPINMSSSDKKKMNSHKKKALVSIVFQVIGAIILFAGIVFMGGVQ